MAPNPCLTIGPLRLVFDTPPQWRPTGAAVFPGFYDPDLPFQLKVPLRLVALDGPGARDLPLAPQAEASQESYDTGSSDDEVWVRGAGAEARLDLRDKAITIEVRPGQRPIFPGRFFCSLLLPEFGCFAVHASSMVRDGRAYVFPGHSGAGKSTISRIADAAGLVVLNDDTVVLGTDQDGRVMVWGTTFHGDAPLAAPGPAPLAGLFFLSKAVKNSVVPLTRSRALARLMANTFPETGGLLPAHARSLTDTLLNLAHTITSEVPAYELHFRPTAEILEELP